MPDPNPTAEPSTVAETPSMPAQPPPPSRSANQDSILGVATESLAGVSVDEIFKNKTAITMVMHYYKQLVDQNLSLRNQLNTATTYVDAYKAKRTYSTIAASLFLASNIGIGFGVNLLTAQMVWPGLASLIPAVGFAVVGLAFTFRSGT